ncbi:unnamed protein product [Calypogeia fissa]
MEDTSNSNAGLMRRIVQLETEKEELQRDIETLCMQQSGFVGGSDIGARLQSRRAAGFEQELEACKQKLALHSKENLNLQEELTELFRAKGRVADAYKAAMDKNKELEKEVKFYQTRMAGAFNERDKAILEVESLHVTEKTMAKDLRDLHHRLEQTMAQCSEQENSFKELQQSMEGSIVELKRGQKVVEKFWQIRGKTKENGDKEEAIDKLQILLEDDDANWVYCLASDEKDHCSALEHSLAQAKEELERSKDASVKLEEELSQEQSASTRLEYELALLESASTKIKEELASVKSESGKRQDELEFTKAMLMDVQRQLEGEHFARMDAEEKIPIISDQLALKQYTLVREVHHLQAQHVSLKKMVSALLESEKRQVSQVEESVQILAEKVKSLLRQDTTPNIERKGDSLTDDIQRNPKTLKVLLENEAPSQDVGLSKEQNDNGGCNVVNIVEDDSKKILAQALQEKMEALLLLSQQEERYYLEALTQSALESQISELSQKLEQATGEKVKALLELADERHQIQQLQGRERELTQWLEEQRIAYPGGELERGSQIETRVSSLAGDSSGVPALEDRPVVGPKQRLIAGGGYLKGWLRGLDISAFKTTSSVTTTNNSVPDVIHTSATDGANIGSRPSVEDAALQERVAGMERLAKSAHRLRMLLVKVASDSEGEVAQPSIQSAIEVVESVKSEAKQLAVTLGSALPVSFQGPLESSPENSGVESSSEEILEGNNGQVDGTSVNDLIPFIAKEITELLLATAELQAQSLQARLESASTGP